MMAAPALPPEILARILREQLREESLAVCLRLRLVSKYFDEEVLRCLIDLGEVERRFYSRIVHKSEVDSKFALRYWLSFLRKARRESSNPPRVGAAPVRSNTEVSESASDVASEASAATRSVSWTSDGTDDGGLRTRTLWLRSILLGAVTMLLSGMIADVPATSTKAIVATQDANARDDMFEVHARTLCEAVLCLLGGKDSMVFLAPHDRWLRHMHGVDRHLSGKSSEFYAVITAVYVRNWELAKKYLEHFRIDHQRNRRWLHRLDDMWHQFSWRSSKREKEWLEVISACLIIATQNQDLEFVHYLLNVDPGVFTPAFASIRFNARNALDHVISRGHLQLFQIMIERGWSVVQKEDALLEVSDHYIRALKAAVELETSSRERLGMVRILFILSPVWQRSHTLHYLLMRAARYNDTALGQLMMALLSERPIKWLAPQAASYELEWRYSDEPGRDALDVATQHCHLDMIRFLLRNKERITSTVPESWSFINPQRAVGQIVLRGEPIDLDCFREVVFAARHSDLGGHFIKAAALLSSPALAILAENVDLHASSWGSEIIVIEEQHLRRTLSSQGSVPTTPREQQAHLNHTPGGHIGSPNERVIPEANVDSDSASISFDIPHTYGSDVSARPSTGETALANALETLHVSNARLLIERFGVKLTWGAVDGKRVLETEEAGMGALQALRTLLAEHGMLMETKLIYAPVFHPSNSASTATFGKHDRGQYSERVP